MLLEVATMSPEQLQLYAAGYTDALAEFAPELAAMGEYVRGISDRMARLYAENERLYHQAYRNCHAPIAWRRVHTIR